MSAQIKINMHLNKMIHREQQKCMQRRKKFIVRRIGVLNRGKLCQDCDYHAFSVPLKLGHYQLLY